jgi:hypothetical protein
MPWKKWAALGSIVSVIACGSDGDTGSDAGPPPGNGGSPSAGTGGSSSNGAGASTNGGAKATGGGNGNATGGAGTGARPSAGGNATASGGASSTDSGDGGNDGSNGNGGASGGAGGSSCTRTTDVSLNDSLTGTGPDQFDFEGTWATAMAPGKYEGDDHYSSTTGDTATLNFAGGGVALHSAKASHHGIAEITVDGGTAENVDLYAADRADDVEVWKSSAIGNGMHTLRIRVSGKKNDASTGTTVSVDRVVVQRRTCTSGTGGTSNGGSGNGGTAGGGSGNGGTGTGGMGSGGSGGSHVLRPGYNTGPGFFVVGNKLYDANGAEFRIRGVNKLHWDASSPGIPKTHANTERWVMDFNQPTSTNLKLMQTSVDDHIVPMPGNWDGTCKEDASTLSSIVDTWVAQASAWKTYDKYMILNIANEWGPAGTVWRDSYITAIGRLRSAGYLSTISVTSGGCGQNNDDLVNYAAAVLASDPQKNVIFDQHIYGGWGDGKNGTVDLQTGLDKLAATGLAIIVGEFGPGRNIGPSPTTLTPGQIIQGCEARGLGWLAWAWDDPASNADDTWFALSKNGDYSSSADLTTFGKDVVENTTYGLLVLAHPATVF